MKWLLVGDPHVVADELADCERLIDGIESVVKAERPDFVVFMGDQHHNHAIVHVEVMAFWKRSFARIKALGVDVLAIVGNHDRPGDGVSRSHAMLAYQEQIAVIDRPWPTAFDVVLLPYTSSESEFRSWLDANKQKVVFCHQTFAGSRYENGFFAPDGFALEGYEDRVFVSGHIHTPQRFANVTYIGAPRWRSLSDAGIDRALVLYQTGEGQPQILKIFDTSTFCQRLVRVVDRQDAPVEPEMKTGWKYVVDIHGDEAYVKARRTLWPGARIRTFVTRTETRAVSESMGIRKAVSTFLEGFKPKYGTSPAILKSMVAQRLGFS